MATPKPPDPVTLLVGMLSARPELFDAAQAELVERYGHVDLASPVIEFNFTDYYDREMGAGLKRKFLSFAQKIDPGRLAEIKIETNGIEEHFAREQTFAPRPINIDPGYICGSKLVLASAKDRSQRLYLGRGIYAEITLEFRNRTFRPVETTYRDYASPEYIAFFTEVRARHLAAREEETEKTL